MVESSDVSTRPPSAEITRELVQPPSRVYIGVDDRLYIRSRNSLAAVTLQIAGRLLTAQGVIVPFNFEHVPATNRTKSLEGFRLAEGYLLSVVAFPSAGAPLRGQTFVELGLLRGRDVAASVVDVLARDYVAEAEPLAFPGSRIRSSIEGPGALLSVAGADPGVAAEILVTVPTDARWLINSIRATLVTDVNAATRVPLLIIDDGTDEFSRTLIAAIPASQTTEHTWFSNGSMTPDIASIAAFRTGIGRTYLPAGSRIRTETASIQAGDDWSAPQLNLEEWIED